MATLTETAVQPGDDAAMEKVAVAKEAEAPTSSSANGTTSHEVSGQKRNIVLKSTTGHKEVQANVVEPFTKLMEAAFVNDPGVRYMLIPSLGTEERRLAYLPTWFKTLWFCCSSNGGFFEEANDFSAGALWMPPGKDFDNLRTYLSIETGFPKMLFKLGISAIMRMLLEYEAQTKKAKVKTFGKKAAKDRKFWYLFFIGTHPDSQGQGLAAAMIRKYQAIAANDKVPIWLEASTERSSKIYAKLGFELVSEFYVGKGKANSDGFLESGGPGVCIRPMVWHPPKSD